MPRGITEKNARLVSMSINCQERASEREGEEEREGGEHRVTFSMCFAKRANRERDTFRNIVVKSKYCRASARARSSWLLKRQNRDAGLRLMTI